MLRLDRQSRKAVRASFDKAGLEPLARASAAVACKAARRARILNATWMGSSGAPLPDFRLSSESAVNLGAEVTTEV